MLYYLSHQQEDHCLLSHYLKQKQICRNFGNAQSEKFDVGSIYYYELLLLYLCL